MPVPHQPAHAPARVKDRPTWLISRAYALSSGLLNASFEAHGSGLRGYHYRLLAALDEWGPASQADLGRSTGIDRSDVTAALAELESRGLIERTVDPEHKRRNIVTITPEGGAQLLDLDMVIDRVQDELLAPLTATQRRQFLTLMSRLLEETRATHALSPSGPASARPGRPAMQAGRRGRQSTGSRV